MDILSNLTELSDERLSEYAAEVREAFDAIAALDTPTAEQVTEAEGLADHLDAIGVEQQGRAAAAEELAARAAALRSRFATDEPTDDAEDEGREDGDDGEDDSGDDDGDGDVQAEDEAPPVAARSRVATLARRTPRPPKPKASYKPVAITAAADVPEFATGSTIDSMTQVAVATINRMRGFGTPTGDGTTENFQHYGVASFHLDFPKELTIDRHSDDQEVVDYARSEKRLPGGSLVAAAGWCAPSEVIYDLCGGETLDGLLSVPEVNVARGGIKTTRGIDFGTIYSSVGFCQTEAQAIAGTTKPCYEVPCPTFNEYRLDACGLCIKVPILLNAGYPEVVARVISGAMVAHQHKMNNKVILAIAAGSTAKTATGLGASATDTVDALTLYGDQTRQKYRLGLNDSLEVVVPFWVKDVLKIDIARRSAIATEVVQDSDVAALFAAHNLAVQYVYDWQELPYTDVTGPPAIDADKWPTTFDALLYPAGAWVKGTADVINLNAVYDAASLATNTYTGLFFEQGILVAPQCYDSQKVTIPVCSAGRSGIQNLTCA